MARNWTDEQKCVIDQTDSNLLVAAAAGSGKTAVMVERIIRRVLSKDKPVDIDRIVVVTFTKAAANEMRERIGKALFDAMKNETDYAEKNIIRRQLALLENSLICTIDSFCNYILRNYFNTIDLDPAFRIGDEGELKLMMSDVADEVIEAAYEQGGAEFLDFVESYVPGKSDKRLAEWILKLYDFSQSNPYPEKWLNECRAWYEISSEEEFVNSRAVQFMLENIRLLVGDYASRYAAVLEALREPGGILEYVETFEREQDFLEKIATTTDYNTMKQLLETGFVRLPNAPKGADEEIKRLAQNTRNDVKKRLSEYAGDFFGYDVDVQLSMIKLMKNHANVIINLTLDFMRRFDEEKRESNVLSFSDIEHLALKALLEEAEDGYRPTFVAKELSRLYEEIYIDEYQDSNMVQELILSAISRQADDYGNMFMVGDIKQSIYSFRQADPKIFLGKYNTYTENGACGDVLITLHKNFRSRANVLESVNDIFDKIMHSNLGGVEYDKDARLVPGREYPENSMAGGSTELLIYDAGTAGEQQTEEEDTKKRVMLAKIAANRIKELTGGNFQVWDAFLKNGEGDYRTAKYSDIVILLRSANVAGPEYVEVLMKNGIPAICNTAAGYFSAREVAEVLNILSIIDNIRQDIPLAGALRSYYCYLTAEELALIRVTDKKLSLYDCILQYISENKKTPLAGKLISFLEFIEGYRKMAGYTPIHELVRMLIYDTGYVTHVAAMGTAKKRIANVDMLIEKAKAYEDTSFHGLFNFLRYIEKLKKYELDMGEADVFSESDNVVRIMSIHKSKGLEFPVVIVGDMDKRYNLMDANDRIILNAEYGIGMDYVDLNYRIRRKSLIKRIIAESSKLNMIGEELRILYVALTRASEKLILIGSVGDALKAEAEWKLRAGSEGGDYAYVYSALNYLDLCAPAFFQAVPGAEYSYSYIEAKDLYEEKTEVKVQSGEENVLVMSVPEKQKPEVMQIVAEKAMPDEDCAQNIKARFTWQYPYKQSTTLPGKYSVSELKHMTMEETEDETVIVPDAEPDKPVPFFMKECEESDEESSYAGGTNRGNAYHKFFEFFDYNVEADKAAIQEQLNNLVIAEKISKEYAELINVSKYVAFLKSDIGLRMKRAALAGELFREQQFITGFPAEELKTEAAGCKDIVLLQGIIDAYFVENGEIVIVDYKTDRVTTENYEYILTNRYKRQLELYGATLAQITGKNVKERVIYSVSVNREIVF